MAALFVLLILDYNIYVNLRKIKPSLFILLLCLFVITIGVVFVPRSSWRNILCGHYNNFATVFVPTSPDGLTIATSTGTAFTPTGTSTFIFHIYSYTNTDYGRVYSANYTEASSTDFGAITAINITPTKAGTGYGVNDELFISGGNGLAKVKVASTTTGGGIEELSLLNAGAGYSVGTSSLVSATGTGAEIRITSVDSPYNLLLNWNPITGADGYTVVVSDNVNKYTNNYSIDVASGTPTLNYTGTEGTSSVSVLPYDSSISTGTITLNQNQYVYNLTLATGGTLDLNGHTLNVEGDWNNTGGTLNISHGGTVNLIGTSVQSILGTNTFYNLTKNASVASTLIFDSAATTTITNNLAFSGTAGNLLSLRPNTTLNYFATVIFGGGYIHNPFGISVDSSDNIYVGGSSGFYKYDSNGTYISTIAPNGSGDGQSFYVSGIAFDSLGNIIVSEYGNHRVQKFSPSGVYMSKFGDIGSDNGQFVAPMGLVVDSSDNIYVSDFGNNRVQKFDKDGNFIWWLGYDGNTGGVHATGSATNGSSNGQFYRPKGIAIDASDNIYVVDHYNARVQKFDKDGNFIWWLGYDGSTTGIHTTGAGVGGTGNGQLNYPERITIDSAGNIYVLEASSYRIQKFDSSGNYISTFGARADNDRNQYAWASAITTDSSDNIYVTEQNNWRVQKFGTTNFNILHTGGTISLTYLDVAGSSNISSSPFICSVGCITNGNNTNWSLPVLNRGRRFSQKNVSENSSVDSVIETATTTATTTPTHIDSTNSDLVITPSQSGSYSTDTSVGKVILEVPALAVTGTTTFSVAEASTTSTTAVSSSTQIKLAGDTTYDITAQDNDGNYIHSFASPLTITIPIPTDATSTENLGVYYYDEATIQWVLVPDAVFSDGKAVFTVNHLTKFAIFSTVSETISKKKESIPEEKILEVVSKIKRQVSTSTEEQNNISSSTENVLEKATSTIVAVIASTTASTTPEVISNKTVLSNIGESVKQNYEQTAVVVNKSIEVTKEIVNSPVGIAVTNVVSTAGVVAGASASVGAIAFATPLSAAEIWLIPARIFGLLMGALGTKRKNRQWGTVYDSVTKRPLDPVYVTLINTETDKEVVSAITDLDGRYGFLVLPGKYRIVTNKTNYTSPSIIMKGKSFDEVYNDLYFGEEIVITKEGEIITKNIPMDPMSFNWNEFAKTKMNVNTFMKEKDIKRAKLSKFLFTIGALISLVSLIFAPSPYNVIIAGFYVLSYIFNYIVFQTKKSGLLTEKNTKIPLSFAIVKIFREGENTPIVKKIADKFGQYYSLVPKGKYYIKIDKKNDDATYTEIYQSPIIDIKKGVINFDFSL